MTDMHPTGHLRDGTVRVGGDARQRFYDGRGYGRPLDGNEIA
ncbi:tRNA splicing endonuclease, partial [Halorubrum hochstenium ATCC 700873]